MVATPRRRAPAATANRPLDFMRQAGSRGGIGELVDVIAAGDKVVVILRPVSAVGEQAALSANLTTFRDGKVRSKWCTTRAPRTRLAAAGA